ncbi:MAG: hypothetical protein B1H12_09450 [Desulfobacteraceae bacterium 4484_190.2]|nr:MAG: hypothetical protein B1H12_09450 [Desulfobacteraceae bacterium 4484_190.2]
MNIETTAKKMADVLGEAVVQETLKKLIQIEMAKCLRKMGKLEQELVPYEKRFEMSSHEAWTEYRNGKLGDDGDIMEWMMLFENFQALEKQHDRLMEINRQ